MSSTDRKNRRGGASSMRWRSSSEKRKPSGSPTDSLAPKTPKQLVQSVFSFGSTSTPIQQEKPVDTTSDQETRSENNQPANETSPPSSPTAIFDFINTASVDVLTSKLSKILLLPKLQEKFQQSFIAVAKDIMQGLVEDIVAPLQQEIRELKHQWETKTAPLQQEIRELKHQLETKTDELEQYSRRNSIRIAGVPEEAHEVTEDVVMDVLKDTHPNITVSDIDRCHRVGRKTPDGKRVIIVKFISYWDRNKVISNRRALRNKRPHVYINDDLTQTRSRLFKLARDLKAKGKIESTWTYDGRVLVCEQKEGLIRVVNCDSDLDKYK